MPERPPIPTVASTPTCPACGVAVAVRGEPCPACAHKPQFHAPKGMIEVGPQPEPAYHREGNFRRPPQPPPAPETTPKAIVVQA